MLAVHQAEAARKGTAEPTHEVEAQASAEHEEQDDEHAVPVRVRSVMNRLRPSGSRYSFHREEL